jgi:hypothetical protein
MQLPTSQSVRYAIANIASGHSTFAYSEKQHSGLKMFIALLQTDSKFFHSAVANSCLL